MQISQPKQAHHAQVMYTSVLIIYKQSGTIHVPLEIFMSHYIALSI